MEKFNDMIDDEQLKGEVVVAHRLGYWYPVEDSITAEEIQDADDLLERYVQLRIKEALDN